MDIKYIYTIFFMSILALSCSRKIGSTQAIQKTPETYNYFISADEWNKKSNMFYIATDSATLSYVSEEYKYKTRRAHLNSYYPCVIVTKKNKLVYSVPGKTLVKSNLDLIKDSLELRVRKEKNLEKKPLIKFLKHLKMMTLNI
ncbi:MAG: hypothetical protein ACPGVD_11165 [Flavobacteriales bacterium]